MKYSLILALLACQFPSLPKNAEGFDALPSYGHDFQVVQYCVGHPAKIQLGQMSFYRVPTITFGEELGLAYLDSHRIVMGALSVNDTTVVRHLLAHQMYQVQDHPDSIFTRCNLGVSFQLGLK